MRLACRPASDSSFYSIAMAKSPEKTKPDKDDLSYGRTAVAMGLITADQLKKCLNDVQKSAASGAPQKKIDEALVEAGLLNQAQVEMVRQEAVRRSEAARRIAGYELVSEIGRGAMGVVHKARQISLDRFVALKLIPKTSISEKDKVHLITEAQAAAKLNHENIVQAIDAGETESHVYFAMELFEGRNLLEILREKGKLAEPLVCEIGVAVAKALEHAHANRMIHRDIKPENVLMDREGRIKLTDMGLARSAERGAADDPLKGSVVGTPYYISPEQIKAMPDIDIRTDIYSLGATLYYLATGSRPFEAESPVLVLKKHLSEPLDPPVSRNPGLSAEFDRIVRKAMEKNREKRYGTPSELKEDLSNHLRKGPAAMRAQAPSSRGRAAAQAGGGANKAVIGGVLAAACAGAVIAGIVIFGGGKDKPQQGGKTAVPAPSQGGQKTDDPGSETAGNPKDEPGIEEFNALKAWGAEKPLESDEVIRRLEDLRKKYPRTRVVTLCRDEISALQERKRKATSEAFEKARQKAAGLASEKKFGEAVESLRKFPEQLLNDQIKAGLDAACDRILKEAAVEAEAQAARADAAADAGDFAAAAEAVKAIQAFGVPSLWDKYKGRLEEYSESAFASAHLELHRKLLEEIASKGPGAGAAFVAAKLSEDVDPNVKDLLREDSLNVDWARGALQRLCALTAGMKGSNAFFLLRTGEAVSGQVTGVEGEKISFKAQSGAKSAGVRDLRASDASGIMSASDPAGRFQMACYSWYIQNDGSAAWAFLSGLDHSRREVRRLASSIERFECARISEILARAGAEVEKGNLEAASAALREVFALYRGRPSYFKSERAVLDLLARANARTGRPPLAEAVVSCPMEWPGRTKLRLIYDFRNPAHASDLWFRGGRWSASEGFLVQGESQGGQMEAGLPGSFRDVTVLMEVMPLSGKFHGIGVNFLGQADGRRCAFDMRGNGAEVSASFFFRGKADMPYMKAMSAWKQVGGEAAGEGFRKVLLVAGSREFSAMVGGLGADAIRVGAGEWDGLKADGFQRFVSGTAGIRASSPAAVRKLEAVGDPEDGWVRTVERLCPAAAALSACGEFSLMKGGLHECWTVSAGSVQLDAEAVSMEGLPAIISLQQAAALAAGRRCEVSLDLECGQGIFFIRLPAGYDSALLVLRGPNAALVPGVSAETHPLSVDLNAQQGQAVKLRFVLGREGARMFAGDTEILNSPGSELARAAGSEPGGPAFTMGCFGEAWKVRDLRIKSNPQ